MIGELLMNEYTLFLDESEIPITNNEDIEINRLFVIAGIIVENSYHDNELTLRLNSLKECVWKGEKGEEDKEISHSHILHEMEVTFARYGNFGRLKHKYLRIFAKPSKYRLLYNEMSKLIDDSNIVTLGSCIRQTELHSIYNYNVINDKKSILMQIIIENFYHFLVESNSIGTICYESMHESENAIIKRRYTNIRTTGTMFYPAKNINKRIKNLVFIPKDDNITGLQIADFIPNTLGRVECNKNSHSDKTYNSVYNKLYDGNRKMIEKFGLKIIP